MPEPNNKPRIMTDDEILNMVQRLEGLRARGWTMTQIADHLGYSNPSTLYAARRDLRGIEIERYRKLCRADADRLQPPLTGRPRNSRKPTLPEERVDWFLEVVADLQEGEVTKDALSKVAGYGSRAGLRMALRTRRIPVEVHDRIMQLAEAKGVVKAPPRLCPVPSGENRSHWGVIDYFKAITDHLEVCLNLVEEAGKVLSTPLTALGFKHFGRRLQGLLRDVRVSVG